MRQMLWPAASETQTCDSCMDLRLREVKGFKNLANYILFQPSQSHTPFWMLGPRVGGLGSRVLGTVSEVPRLLNAF